MLLGGQIMLRRDILDKLTEWKNRDHRPLIISGLRQTGKTFIVREFGKQFYKNTVYLDFRANRSVHTAFEGDFSVDQMVMSISAAMPSVRFLPGETLIIFDEIQDCPNARSSLKYWDIDGRYDVIATGSFLGVKGFRKPYTRGIPVGYEEQITMYPLSFHEFVRNIGISEEVFEYASTSVEKHTAIEKTIHESLRLLYYQYLIVGGMPEAVNVFLDKHDLNSVRKIQRRILTSIRDDFGRYKDDAGNDKINETLKLRAEACLDSLPAQLSKEYKKFQFSLVNARGHSPEKAEGLQYLEDVGLVIKAYNTNEISYPLEGVKISNEFKAYFIDTGLLISQMGEDVPAMILSGNISAYKGAIAENMIASAFASSNRKLYYFHAPSGSPELDFLFEDEGKVTIVECKASNNRATSMKFVIAHPEKYGEHPAIKYSDTNVGIGNGFYTYPLYAIGLTDTKTKREIIPLVDVSGLKAPKQDSTAEV